MPLCEAVSFRAASFAIAIIFSPKSVGYQGSGKRRPIYETTINGKTERLAVTVGSNGFIVGANF